MADGRKRLVAFPSPKSTLPNPGYWPNLRSATLVAKKRHIFRFYALFEVFILANCKTVSLHVGRINVGDGW